MANPLFNMLNGSAPTASGQQPTASNQAEMMQKLRNDPAGMIRQAGYSVPDEIAGNPQATVMHLLQTGQIGGPMMQKIQSMLNMLMGRR